MNAKVFKDPRIEQRLSQLPDNFYGRVVLFFEYGRLWRMEVTESIKPIVDRAPAPIEK